MNGGGGGGDSFARLIIYAYVVLLKPGLFAEVIEFGIMWYIRIKRILMHVRRGTRTLNIV